MDCARSAEYQNTYPLLRQLSGSFILAIAEQFNNTTLIWSESVQRKVLSASVFR